MSFRTRVPALTVGALIALSPLAAGAVLSPAAAITADEQAFLDAINTSRAAAGLAPLTYSEQLSALADRHSAQMASSGTVYHSTDLASMVGTVYANWTRVGENVGKGSTVESIHSAMMASPSHQANILGDYNLVGIGVETNPGGVMFVTELFAKAVVEATSTTTSTAAAVEPEPVAVTTTSAEPAPGGATESTASATRKVSQARSSKQTSVTRTSNASAMGAARSAAGLGGRHGPPEWAQNERSGR